MESVSNNINYDVPVFQSLPEKIENNINESNSKIKTLNNISVIDMYKYEVFSNMDIKKIYDTKYIIIFLYFIILIYIVVMIYMQYAK
jgi:hypothetical protein